MSIRQWLFATVLGHLGAGMSDRLGGALHLRGIMADEGSLGPGNRTLVLLSNRRADDAGGEAFGGLRISDDEWLCAIFSVLLTNRLASQLRLGTVGAGPVLERRLSVGAAALVD